MTNQGQQNLSLVARMYFRIREYKLIKRHLRKLRKGEDLRLTQTHSRNKYEAYDDSEIQKYEGDSVRTLANGTIRKVPFKEIREIYLDEIYNQIDELISHADGRPIKVLEVGCGNGINLMLLKKRFGKKISLHGFDLSPERIRIGKKHWGEKLEDIKLYEMSATDINYETNTFDLVYSIHVIEQISYLVGEALDEMIRVSRNQVILVEPTYEFGNPAQRLKLILNDQLRTLLPEIRSRSLKLKKSYALHTLANPTSPTGVHVIDVS